MSFVNKVVKNGVSYDIHDARFPEGTVIDETYVIRIPDGEEEPTQEQAEYVWNNQPAKIKIIVRGKDGDEYIMFSFASFEDGSCLTYTANLGKTLVRARIYKDRETGSIDWDEFDSYDVEGGSDIEYASDYQIDNLFPSWKKGYVGNDHTITFSLTGAYTDFNEGNSPATIADGEGMTMYINKSSEDYVYSYVNVTMDGEGDITKDVWDRDENRIYIPSVTGDVNIEVIAVEYQGKHYNVHISTDGMSGVTVYSTIDDPDMENPLSNGDQVTRNTSIVGNAWVEEYSGYQGVNVEIYVGSLPITDGYDPETKKIVIRNIAEDVSISTTAVK